METPTSPAKKPMPIAKPKERRRLVDQKNAM
jgi:hypothetical protein